MYKTFQYGWEWVGKHLTATSICFSQRKNHLDIQMCNFGYLLYPNPTFYIEPLFVHIQILLLHIQTLPFYIQTPFFIFAYPNNLIKGAVWRWGSPFIEQFEERKKYILYTNNRNQTELNLIHCILIIQSVQNCEFYSVSQNITMSSLFS